MIRCFKLLLFVAVTALISAAADKEHATLVRDATLYVLPSSTSEKLVKVTRGRDLIVLERTNMDNQPWFKVYVTLVEGESQREISGWLPAKGVITVSTANGDQIIYGEAADSEMQAEQRGGRKGAAQDAMRLYYRMQEFFPNSPLAGEALWRAADVRWQLDKSDMMRRPSSREMDPDVRDALDDRVMK